MKKIASAMLVVGIGLIGITPTVAGATNDNNPVNLTYPPSSENVHLKTTICHWANGNLSEPSVSINAVDDPQDTGHGMLTLTNAGSLASFVAHVDPPGHTGDAIIDIYLKHDNDVVYLYQGNTLCNPAPTTTTTLPPTTTTTVPPTTTTTAPVVTTTTQPPVVTTTTAPPVTTTTVAPPVVTVPVAPEAPAAPVAETPSNPEVVTALPHTGAKSAAMATFAGGLVLIGLALQALAKKRVIV